MFGWREWILNKIESVSTHFNDYLHKKQQEIGFPRSKAKYSENTRNCTQALKQQNLQCFVITGSHQPSRKPSDQMEIGYAINSKLSFYQLCHNQGVIPQCATVMKYRLFCCCFVCLFVKRKPLPFYDSTQPFSKE